MKFNHILLTAILLVSCVIISCSSSEFNEKDYEHGKNGEHPKAHTLKYESSFKVLKEDFYKTIEAFHTFAQYNGCEPSFNICFNSLYEVTFDNNKLPCIVTYANKGVPIKVHMTFTVKTKDFNNHDGINYLKYSVKLSTLGDHYDLIIKLFEKEVEPKLLELNTICDRKL